MEYTIKTRDELLAVTRKRSDKLLVSGGAGHSIQNALHRLTKQLQVQDGCKIQNLQQIRASVITHWLKLYNLRQTQCMAGHRFVSSTEAYMVNDLEGLLEDINKFHPIAYILSVKQSELERIATCKNKPYLWINLDTVWAYLKT
jgi:site-specific recombinase XerD